MLSDVNHNLHVDMLPNMHAYMPSSPHTCVQTQRFPLWCGTAGGATLAPRPCVRPPPYRTDSTDCLHCRAEQEQKHMYTYACITETRICVTYACLHMYA